MLENGSETRLLGPGCCGAQCNAFRVQGGGDELLRRYDDSVKSKTPALELPTASEAPSCRVRGVWGPSRSAKRLDITKTQSLINSSLQLRLPSASCYFLYQVRTRSTSTNTSLYSPIGFYTRHRTSCDNVGHSPPIDSRPARSSASFSGKACHGHGQHPVHPRQGHSP